MPVADGLVSVKRHPVRGLGRSGRDRHRGAGQALFRVRRALAESADRDARRQACRSSASKAIRWRRRLNAGDDILVDLGDAAERLRDGIYVLRVDDALVVKRHRASSDGPAGDGPVGQSGLSRLARLRDRRDQLHRPGDLGGPQGRLSLSRRRSISHDAGRRAPTPTAVPISTPFIGLPIARPTAKPARMQRVRKHPPARVVLRIAMPGAHATPVAAEYGQRRVDDIRRQSRNGASG